MGGAVVLPGGSRQRTGPESPPGSGLQPGRRPDPPHTGPPSESSGSTAAGPHWHAQHKHTMNTHTHTIHLEYTYKLNTYTIQPIDNTINTHSILFT